MRCLCPKQLNSRQLPEDLVSFFFPSPCLPNSCALALCLVLWFRYKESDLRRVVFF